MSESKTPSRSNPITSKTAWALYVGQVALGLLGYQAITSGHLEGPWLACVVCVIAVMAAMLAAAGVAGFAAVDRAFLALERAAHDVSGAASGRASTPPAPPVQP